MSTATELIAAERIRQVTEKGYTPERDDGNNMEELAEAAISHIVAASKYEDTFESALISWPWDNATFNGEGGPIRNLVKAGALIVAEIERLQRAQLNNPKEKTE